ncbi:MAG: hypothetical protein QME81_18835, partial [bacterium]|nr:hypothetical protein [bacterium]
MLLITSSGNYWMYFVYDWAGDNSIKGASSSDGLNWTIHELTGFPKGCMDPEVIVAPNGEMWLYLAAPICYPCAEPMYLYRAVSSNGINWTITDLVIKAETDNEGKVIGDPDIVEVADYSYRMYYYDYGKTSGQTDTYKILSATAVFALIADAGPDERICTGAYTTLHGSAAGGSSPYTYAWSPATGLSDTTTANPTACPDTTTTYTLTVTDNNGCTDDDQVAITVNPSPT